jgi:hypothetical protein
MHHSSHYCHKMVNDPTNGHKRCISKWDLKGNPVYAPLDSFNNDSSRVCHLIKTLYGLKQSSCKWNAEFDMKMRQKGYKYLCADPCVVTNFSSPLLVDGKLLPKTELRSPTIMWLSTLPRSHDPSHARSYAWPLFGIFIPRSHGWSLSHYGIMKQLNP